MITTITNATMWTWAYGDPSGNSQPVSTGITYNLRFPGQYADQESGLFYNMNRYYNPSIGRYTQVDPIGLNGGMNPYAYVDNNPVNAIDSSGLDVWIEGSSGDEPLAHESLAIGDPNGFYKSYAFAIDGMGRVYEDKQLGGQILEYLKSTPEQDNMMIRDLDNMAIKDNKKIYGWDYTCIGWTEEKFKYFRKKYQLNSAPFKQRPQPERGWLKYLILPTSSSSNPRMFN